MNNSTRIHWLACVLILVFSGTSQASQTESLPIIQQRVIYKDALEHLQKNEFARYQKLRSKIRQYPLMPYLEFQYVLRRMALSRQSEVEQFIQRHYDTPLAKPLHQEWLRFLAKHEQWQMFLQQQGEEKLPRDLQCLSLRAKLATQEDFDWQQVEYLWLTPNSQPKSCNPLLSQWKKKHLTPDLVWQRIDLALLNNKTSFADYLLRYLPKNQQSQGKKLLTAQRSPAYLGRKDWLKESHTQFDRIAYFGMRSLIRKKLNLAVKYWPKYRDDLLKQNPMRANKIDNQLALKLARSLKPEAETWLWAMNEPSDEVFEWRFRWALRQQNWPLAQQIIAEDIETYDARKHYWLARLHEEINLDFGVIAVTEPMFERVPEGRNFYSFLAADRLGQNYNFNVQDQAISQYVLDRVNRVPGIQRALELYALGEHRKARREWFFTLDTFEQIDQIAAAHIAKQWGWHHLAIATLGEYKLWHEIDLRFPLGYREYFARHARTHRVSPAWLYAIARQESAFNEQALSSAGARGLLQVMPATAKQTAQRYGLSYDGPADLYQPKTAIAIGSAFLSELGQRFDQNPFLATAAYNAGPARVNRWLNNGGSELPFDVWVETIPYDETRHYVMKVMTYQAIYGLKLASEFRLNPQGSLPQSITKWAAEPVSVNYAKGMTP